MSSPISKDFLKSNGFLACAVCGKPGAVGGFPVVNWPLNADFSQMAGHIKDGRDRIVFQIVLEVQIHHHFEVGGLEAFWKKFRQELCSSCQSKLDSINSKKRRALKLLEESVRLDPNNKVARENRDVLKKMD